MVLVAKDEDANDEQHIKLQQVQGVREERPKPPLCNIMASEPMDLVHIDLLGLETSMNTKVHPTVVKILIITDHFSCHVRAYKVDDKRAVTIAKCLYDNYFRHYGFPR